LTPARTYQNRFVDLLVMVAVVFAVNLLPAFGPPTWLILA
jgi:hypothetical protein